jgi:hypothetical protein
LRRHPNRRISSAAILDDLARRRTTAVRAPLRLELHLAEPFIPLTALLGARSASTYRVSRSQLDAEGCDEVRRSA